MNSPTHLEKDPRQENLLLAVTEKRLSASKSRSRSSSSSSLSSCPSVRDSPTTPLQSSGIPFSWEHQPGVPKHLKGATPDSLPASRSRHFYVIGSSLPPPPPLSSLPAGATNRLNSDSVFAIRKKKSHDKVHDPFLKALVECSKPMDQRTETYWQSPKACKSRSAPLWNSDRFQISCKTSCEVLQSQVLLPRSYRSNSYGLLTNRSI